MGLQCLSEPALLTRVSYFSGRFWTLAVFLDYYAYIIVADSFSLRDRFRCALVLLFRPLPAIRTA